MSTIGELVLEALGNNEQIEKSIPLYDGLEVKNNGVTIDLTNGTFVAIFAPPYKNQEGFSGHVDIYLHSANMMRAKPIKHIEDIKLENLKEELNKLKGFNFNIANNSTEDKKEDSMLNQVKARLKERAKIPEKIKITIDIKTDGASFEDSWDEEFADVINKAFNAVKSLKSTSLRDVNGNTIGKVDVVTY